MALRSTDPADLLLPLYEGLHEEPRWATFLRRVQRRTRADYVGLIFGQGDAPLRDATQWFTGADVQARAQELADLAALDPTPYHRLRPGRVYSAAEMIDPDDPRHDRFRRDYLVPLGMRHGRFVRVTEPRGGNAWLCLTRGADDFGAADSALLSALAPHLTIALRTLGEMERARFAASVAADALARAGIGWRALDRDGQPIEAGGAVPPPGAPLLTVPVPDRPLTASVMPATVALTREARAGHVAQAEALARLFALLPSEARLALHLADGLNLVEAAQKLGLTIETVRNYSKRLFAKTGTRGQADLVRAVLTSVASLA